MPLDLNNATAIAPPDPGIQATPTASNATEVAPSKLSGLRALPMPPMTEAGLQLAKFVLCILAAALGVLTIYLWTSEHRYSGHQELIYQQVVTQAGAIRDAADRPSLAPHAKALREAAQSDGFQLPAEIAEKSHALFSELKASGVISDPQLAMLKTCIPLPAKDATGRQAALNGCAGIVEEAEKKTPVSPGIERLRLLTEFSKQLNEHRQSFHTAWFQEAQLILLNLLLPMLTGLFGYIFGTQQTPSNRNDNI